MMPPEGATAVARRFPEEGDLGRVRVTRLLTGNGLAQGIIHVMHEASVAGDTATGEICHQSAAFVKGKGQVYATLGHGGCLLSVCSKCLLD